MDPLSRCTRITESVLQTQETIVAYYLIALLYFSKYLVNKTTHGMLLL